ncbi:MAG: efflux RND transporter periplasmic adaptor subunit [Filimonas sp.]|nr:efflux RND transporter periplasmic adaptor subunit [Filimonas sp.]
MSKYILYTCLAVFLFASCKSKPEPKVEKKDSVSNMVTLTDAQYKNAGIATALPEKRAIRTTIKANGTVDVPPQSMVSISFPLGGYLKSTSLLPGSSVRKGQVIAVMEDQAYVQLQQDYLTAKVKMEYLQVDLQRQKELSENNASSQKSYQQVQNDYKVQQVLLKSLEEKLRIIDINPATLNVNNISRDVPVYSPITGYVTKVNVNIGKYVNPSEVLFELVNPQDIHAAITVFEKDITAIQKGTTGKVYLADQPDKPYDIEAILVTRNINENRSGLVHCHFETPHQNLLPGMFLTCVFEINNKEGIVVPEEAVIRSEGKEYVFVAKGNKTYELTPIEISARENGWVALKETSTSNWLHQTVVVKGAYALLGKMKNKEEEE